MKGPLSDQSIFQYPLLPFLQQTFRSQFNHIAGNLAGACSRWHRPKLLSSHTLQFCLLGHMRCITCAMWWNSGAHRGTISIPAECHVTCKPYYSHQRATGAYVSFDYVYIILFVFTDGGPGTTGYHCRLYQTGLAPLLAAVFHPGSQQGDCDETGGTLFCLQLLWGCQLWGEVRALLCFCVKLVLCEEEHWCHC